MSFVSSNRFSGFSNDVLDGDNSVFLLRDLLYLINRRVKNRNH